MESLEIDDCVVTALLESAGSKAKAKKKSKGAKATAAGKLVNLMSSDIDEVYKARDFIITTFNFPLGLMLATWMLWDLLGWRAIPGLIVVFAGLRLAKLAATRIAKAKKAVKKAQDRRVSLLHEYTTSIQYLKQLAWEDLAAASIGKVRAEELAHLWTYNLCVSGLYNSIILRFASCRPYYRQRHGSRRSDTMLALKKINLDVHDLVEGQLNVPTAASLAPLLPPWALSRWAQSSDVDHGKSFSGPKGRLAMSFVLSLVEAGLTMAMKIMFARGAWQAADRLNNEAVLAIMDASPKWHSEEIPGSIVTCLTKDLDSLDTDLGRSLLNVIRLVLQTISHIVVTASIITDFIWPALVCGVLAILVGRAYSKTTRLVKNLVQAARSPVFTLYSETLGGLPILRAARDPGPTAMRVVFGKMLAHKLLIYSRALATQLNLGRWLAIHVEVLAMLLSVAAGAMALLRKDSLFGNGTPAASLALSIYHAVALGDVSLKLIKAWSDLDMEINALNRILHLAGAEPEDIDDGEHMRYNMEDEVWPASGSIRFTNVTAKYDQSDKLVLKDVTLEIKPGEQVAIVGRTGAGKSSIIQTLLRRCVDVDGVDIRTVSRKMLRGSVAYIPQDAVLFNGSIRDNLTLGESIEDSILYKTPKGCAKAAGWNVEALSDTDTPSQDDTTTTTVHLPSAEETSEHSPLLPRHCAGAAPSPVTGRPWGAYSKMANVVARLYSWTWSLRTERPPRDINFAGLRVPRLGSEVDTQNEGHRSIRTEETGSSSAYLSDGMLINHRGTAVRLSTQVRAGGQNFSHGERQVLSLAQALARGRANNGRAGKVFLMDEATSSMDPKMNRAIQEVIRREVGLPSESGYGGGGSGSSNSDMDDGGTQPRPSRQTTYEQDAAPKGRTLITIAHRLQTIWDYDKIVVMDDGRIVQVGCWDALLRDSDGLFAKMVEATGEDSLVPADGQPGSSVARGSNPSGV
ncbi:hypothetical protein PspLS_02897 [Pyricularia sp. CBS 133598]|nr:hypothetical protein PspLS_02897 [Pyricularia sp. CBS 133598]